MDLLKIEMMGLVLNTIWEYYQLSGQLYLCRYLSSFIIAYYLNESGTVVAIAIVDKFYNTRGKMFN